MSWPTASLSRLHSLVLVEARTGALGWLVTNIPGSNVTAGDTIMEYQHPNKSTSAGVLI